MTSLYIFRRSFTGPGGSDDVIPYMAAFPSALVGFAMTSSTHAFKSSMKGCDKSKHQKQNIGKKKDSERSID